MGRLEHDVSGPVDEAGAPPGGIPPQEEDDRRVPLAHETDDLIGERLPALASVAERLVVRDGQDRVQE